MAKKQAWWLRFVDGSIKKVFTETMTEAWKRGMEIGTPVSVSGSKISAEQDSVPEYSKSKESVKAADPQELVDILKYLSNPYAGDPHAGDDTGSLIYHMTESAKRALEIVDNFPKVIIEN